MAELLMECEEEELEPWQQRIKEVEDDDDDDEPIFVREISGSKSGSTNKTSLNTSGVQHGSSRIENGTSTRGTIQLSSNHFKTPCTSNPSVLPVTSIYQPTSKAASSSAVVQPLPRPIVSPEALKRPITACMPSHQPPRASPTIQQPACRTVTVSSNSQITSRNITFPAMTQPALRPVATITAQPVILNQGYFVNSPQVSSNNSPNVMFALRQSTALSQYQGVQSLTATALCRSDIVSIEKRPAAPEVHISPKKPKNNESESESRSATTLSPVKPKPPTPSQNPPLKGTTSTPTQGKNGTSFPRACPKCNILFNLLEPMKRHMKFCCPDKLQNFFLGVMCIETKGSQEIVEEMEKGKLIMLVSDFYYGKHEGDLQLVQKEQKTHTTFKCFSCQKVLKNNVRFMNHMKHHLELEKQSTESWENHTTCHHCYRQFPTPFQLQCHIESSHTLYESTTICKICELSFESEQVLLQHMKDNHKPGEMPYVCQVCNYRSSTFAEVDNHFRNSHENTKCLLCPFCLKVIKSGTTYMQHYMKHQNKGVYRCVKCRLQFLTGKEKLDHKTQHHRTFRKPKQLEGLPPGTKVTIRASVGSIVSTVPPPTSAVNTNTMSNALQVSPNVKNTNVKNTNVKNTNVKNTNVKNTKVKPILTPVAKLKVNKLKPKPKPPPAKKKPATTKTSKRIKMVNTALQNLRTNTGPHKCLECQAEIKDFENHFHTYVHCSKCKFSTNCNKAYLNHTLSFHGRKSNKKSWAAKKASKDKRRITLVCLNCDFLTDVSGLDEMAIHLSANHTHACQVILENVSIFSSTLEGDMSKSRPESSVEKILKYKKHKNGADVAGVTNKSIKKSNSSMKQNTSQSKNADQVKTSISLRKRHIISFEVEKDLDILTPNTCSAKQDDGEAELLNVDIKHGTDNDQDDISSEEVGTASSQNSAVKEFDHPGDIKTASDDSSVHTSDQMDLKRAGEEDVSVEQFLRRQDEPESMSSDVSEESSVHLEPLTPSEVLEHEATEILQKGGVASSPERGPKNEKSEEDIEESNAVSSSVDKIDGETVLNIVES
ncbi:zinc finger protein 280D isoform X2 [Bombina bombina]|uniref:zinc finger protein 280D isoform X2 n=1 Tax=Bombina bombina TaxID=8345 RepID=UPI00235B11E1|nr:zinc finger protein 280D isoform X2 [Bombina bombina]